MRKTTLFAVAAALIVTGFGVWAASPTNARVSPSIGQGIQLGGPADGFQIVGLFADSADAESYAEDHSLRDWWVAEITSPEAFAESQRRQLQAARGASRSR